MALSSDIRDRIFAAADELHRSGPTGEYPKIEAVRQLSRAGMQNVVEGMKEWRAAQHKQVQAVREPLPMELLGEAQGLGLKYWETAQRLANASLEAAKASFETEKRDMDAISAEQAEAFDTQSAELTAALNRITELDRHADATAASAAALTLQLDESREALVVAEQRAAIAEHKAAEVERRAADLRTELTHAHGEAERLLAELVKAQDRADAAGVLIERADARTEQLRESLTSQIGKAELTIVELRASLGAHAAERDKAREAVAIAREDAAGLRGQLEAIKTQNAAILFALKPAALPREPSPPQAPEPKQGKKT